MIKITQNMTGYHLGVSPISDTLQRVQPVLQSVITREGLFAFMAVVRRSTYAAAPYQTFRGPSGYRGRIVSTRGGGARAKFASSGFGNIVEAGSRKRHLAALENGKTSRGQVTKGMLAWLQANAPSLAADLEESHGTAIWAKPMSPKPWVLPTYYAVQAQAFSAFESEVNRQINLAMGGKR